MTVNKIIACFLLAFFCVVSLTAAPAKAGDISAYEWKNDAVQHSPFYGILSVDARKTLVRQSDMKILHPIKAERSGYISTHRINKDESRVLKIQNADGTTSFYNGIIPETFSFADNTAVQKGDKIGLANVNKFYYVDDTQYDHINTTLSELTTKEKITSAFASPAIIRLCRLNPELPICYDPELCQSIPSLPVCEYLYMSLDDIVIADTPFDLSGGIDAAIPTTGTSTPSSSTDFSAELVTGTIDSFNPFGETPTTTASSASDVTSDGRCSVAGNEILTEAMKDNHAAVDAAIDQGISQTPDIRELSCFDVYQAEMFGPVADIFTNASSGLAGGLTGILGDTLGGKLSGMASGALNDLVGASCVSIDTLLDKANSISPKNQLDAMFAYVPSGTWEAKALDAVKSELPSNYMEAIEIGRFYDPNLQIIGGTD